MIRPLVTTVFLLCAFVVASNANYCVDLTSGLVSNLPANSTQVKWTQRPSSNSGRCQLQGVLAITPPTPNGSVVVAMNFENSTAYSFNLGDSPTNDAWGGDLGTTTDDAEIHSYGSWLRVYLSEKAGTKELVKQQYVVQTQVFISLSRNQIFASGGGGFNFFNQTNGLFAMDTMYLGLNRVIHNYQGSTGRTGSGLCIVCIYF